MARTIQLPGVGAVVEDGTDTYQVPGFGAFREDQAAAAAAVGVVGRGLTMSVLIKPMQLVR
jgi:hypothetical protein